MIETFMRLNVTRTIPQEIITGLMMGQYSLHGGVIRWAANTEYAGQIVRHLIPVAQQTIGASLFAPVAGILGTVNTYQLHQLSGQMKELAATTQQVLQIANANMMLSGLNLAVTAVGFAILNEKLKTLEGKLNEIQKEVKSIRTLLELEERSKLAAALRDLLNIVHVKNTDHRHTLLFNSKNILAPISLKYKELLAEADTIETAMAYEEYFCLTSLAHARCLAELGMLDMAHRDLKEAHEFWNGQARRIANELLLGKYPERFLFSDFSQDVPVPILVEWLDFVYGEEKGFGWIDELRHKTKPWYSEKNDDSLFEKGLWGMVTNFTGGDKTKILQKQKEKVIPSLQKLVSRNNILNGFVAQYELLEKHNVTPTEFDRKLASIPSTAEVNGYIILQPAQ
jgi:tetratricopeptide (TPR) repeat protein